MQNVQQACFEDLVEIIIIKNHNDLSGSALQTLWKETRCSQCLFLGLRSHPDQALGSYVPIPQWYYKLGLAYIWGLNF